MIRKGILLSLLLIVLISTYSFAGELKLTDGKIIKGKITDADTYMVTVKTDVYLIFITLPDYKHIPRSAIWEVQAKNKDIALVNAIFPGFFFHGAGHSYAEDDFMAGLIGTAEILSFPCLILGAYGSPGYSIAGVVLFWGSWIFDMAHAPVSAEHYNDRILGEFRLPLQTKISFNPSKSGIFICKTIEF